MLYQLSYTPRPTPGLRQRLPEIKRISPLTYGPAHPCDIRADRRPEWNASPFRALNIQTPIATAKEK